MKIIEVHNQAEYDVLRDFSDQTEIRINGDLFKINDTPENSIVSVRGGTIQYVYGGTIEYVRGGTIQYVEGGTIQYVRGGTIELYTDSEVVQKAHLNAIIICNDVKPKFSKDVKAQIIKRKSVKFTKTDFVSAFNLDCKVLRLYKSVNPETECDFYTGKIHYKDGATVVPERWNPDPSLECGDGLHLSPTPEMALMFNQGKLKICEVKFSDFVVYSSDIRKVRCKKVKVIGDYKPTEAL